MILRLRADHGNAASGCNQAKQVEQIICSGKKYRYDRCSIEDIYYFFFCILVRTSIMLENCSRFSWLRWFSRMYFVVKKIISVCIYTCIKWIDKDNHLNIFETKKYWFWIKKKIVNNALKFKIQKKSWICKKLFFIFHLFILIFCLEYIKLG